MIYREVICPHCGNEITVKSVQEPQKCKWCRRLVKANFTRRGKSRKWNCEVEPVEFTEKYQKSYNDWMDKEIYGYK